jgi:hypothetical protein
VAESPSLTIHVIARCPVDDTECTVDADGWQCPTCRRTWDHDGNGGETPAESKIVTCTHCGKPFDMLDYPPPACTVPGAERCEEGVGATAGALPSPPLYPGS